MAGAVSPRCSDDNCFVLMGEQCRSGESDYSRCPNWTTSVAQDGAIKEVEPATSFRVPWSGSALGLQDLSALVPRGRTILVGVLGAHDAGKTTLLVGTYLGLCRGDRLARARFAGSRTLGAWESLAAWTRFDDAARPPTFPPHTPRGTSRVPGLLHLALRDDKAALRDVLLADAPGEWFTKWSVREDSDEAAGARWVVEHADAFLVVADCKRLSEAKRGGTRRDTRQLIERLGNHVAGRPTVFVWAKSDHTPPEGIQRALREALNTHIPHATEASTTTTQPETLLNAAAHSIRSCWISETAKTIHAPVVGDGAFGAYRGSHGAE